MAKAIEAAEFHVGDILSVITDRLVSPKHIGGVYDILGFMAGEDPDDPSAASGKPRVCAVAA